jgi:hypothetical protein
MTAQDYKAPESIGRLQQRAMFVGGIAAVLCIFLAVKQPAAFVRSYLIGYLLVLGLALGSLGLVMLQHLTSGNWGLMIRRPLEAATRTLPLLAIGFLPIAFLGMRYLYSGNEGETGWFNAPASGEGQLSEFQKSWLTTHVTMHSFFGYYGRAVIYFAVWLFLMWAFNKWSREQDVNQTDRGLRRRFKLLAGPGIILYVFGMSFAAIDWVMSISPHWASTIYGFLFVAGQLISSMGLMIAVVVLLSRAEPFASALKPRYLHDLGKLLFAFLLLWAYFDFSQLLIIWSGNQPEEISFYMSRLRGSWGFVAIVVVVFHFFVPFFVLLSSSLKRTRSLISKVALYMIFMRLVDLFWMTRPEFSKGVTFNVFDILAPIALIGIWLAFFAFNLKQQPLLPIGDPKLAEAIANHEH